MFTILDIVKEFMIEEGFNAKAIVINNDYIQYGHWFLGGTDGHILRLLPFRTNDYVNISPADPKLFDKLREVLTLPTEKDDPHWFAMWSSRPHLKPSHLRNNSTIS